MWYVTYHEISILWKSVLVNYYDIRIPSMHGGMCLCVDLSKAEKLYPKSKIHNPQTRLWINMVVSCFAAGERYTQKTVEWRLCPETHHCDALFVSNRCCYVMRIMIYDNSRIRGLDLFRHFLWEFWIDFTLKSLLRIGGICALKTLIGACRTISIPGIVWYMANNYVFTIIYCYLCNRRVAILRWKNKNNLQ